MDTDKHGFAGVKSKLRAEIRAALKNLPPEKRVAASAKTCGLLRKQPFWRSAAMILFFAPLPGEIDVWPLLEEMLAAGKSVALPRFDSARQRYVARRVQNPRSEIVTGRFGIHEPAAGCPEMPLADLDLALVPGVAFDLRGYRLGRGHGFYDRLLADFAGKKTGIAFDEQVVDAIPAEKQDVRMDFILTPTRCVKCET